MSKPTPESLIKWLRLHGEIDRANVVAHLSAEVERLQTQLDAARALVESAFQVIASDESTLLRENWLKEHQELEAKLKEANDD